MSNITIEFFPRANDTVLAIATRGDDEQFAKGRDEYTAGVAALSRLLSYSAPVQPVVGAAAQRRVAFSSGEMRRFIDEAIANDSEVLIDYTDAEGQKSYGRRVQPWAVATNGNVIGLDVSKNSQRSFKLSRIEKVEVPA